METQQRKRRPRRSPEQRKQIVEDFRQSDLNQKAFCQQHNISPKSLNDWGRNIGSEQTKKRADPSSFFSPVRVVAEEMPAAALEVILSNGRILRVRGPLDAQLFQQVLRLAEQEPSC
jgi:transposase-like protein